MVTATMPGDDHSEEGMSISYYRRILLLYKLQNSQLCATPIPSTPSSLALIRRASRRTVLTRPRKPYDTLAACQASHV